jgi:hypothetical protein
MNRIFNLNRLVVTVRPRMKVGPRNAQGVTAGLSIAPPLMRCGIKGIRYS